MSSSDADGSLASGNAGIWNDEQRLLIPGGAVQGG
jgi:hypothetical protein